MKSLRQQRLAFSLIEVVLAIGIISFAIIPLFGLMSVGLKTNKVSVEELGALTLFSEICYDLKATVDTSGNPVTTSNRYGLKMPHLQASPVTDRRMFRADGSILSGTSSSVLAAARTQSTETIYAVTLRYIPSGKYADPASNQPAHVSILISWPATTDANLLPEGSWQNVATFPQPQAQAP